MEKSLFIYLLIYLFIFFHYFQGDFKQVILGICAIFSQCTFSILHWAISQWGGWRASVYQHEVGMTILLLQSGHFFWQQCCSTDTQLFWSQFKSLSHNAVLYRAGLCLKVGPELPEMNRMQHFSKLHLNHEVLPTSLPFLETGITFF